MNWRFGNVEKSTADNPDTFRIPPRSDREALVVGDYAKLLFLSDDPPAGERMWVEVVDRPSGLMRSYRGTLNSVPVTMGFPAGMYVEFGPEHILDIQGGDTLVAVFDREERDLRVLVGNLLASERHPANFYVESCPTCPWCERGKSGGDETWGESEIEHTPDCPWAALVRAHTVH